MPQIKIRELVARYQSLYSSSAIAAAATGSSDSSDSSDNSGSGTTGGISSSSISSTSSSSSSRGMMKRSDLELKSSDDLETHLRAGLAVLWLYSNHNWNHFYQLYSKEILKDADINAKWMKASIAIANSITEKKLKDLIKKYGTSNLIPKGRRYSVDIENAKDGQGKGRKKSILKVDYVASIIELLRDIYDNDYQKVFVTLEKEGVTKEGKENRGFG